MQSPVTPPYLAPYKRAAEKYGGTFPSLKWSDLFEQEIRFQVITSLLPSTTGHLLDAGCGRADFFKYLKAESYNFSRYSGIEAISELAATAKDCSSEVEIIEADFVKNPESMFCEADVIVFSGSLNTLREKSFFSTIESAFSATTSMLIFNFLCSPATATAPWICWHELENVLDFCRRLTPNLKILSDYRDGDTTVAITK